MPAIERPVSAGPGFPGFSALCCLVLVLSRGVPGALARAGESTDEGASPALHAGTSRIDITPPPGVPMAGYYHVRFASGVHDPLHAKAIVLGRGDARAALVALDLITTTPELVEAARREIERTTGIPGDHVMVTATHAHTGPSLPRNSSTDAALGGDAGEAREYAAALPGKIARGVERALEKIRPARLRAATGHEETLPFNRRFHLKDGGFGWNPGKGNPNILRPAGPVDPDVPVVAFDDLEGNRFATYVNFAMHLDTVGGSELSADFPHVLSRCLSAIHGDDAVTVFTIGCAGDINHVDVNWSAPQKGSAEAARIGTVLAGAVTETLPRLLDISPGPILAAREIVPLTPAPITDAEVAEARAALEKGKDDRAVPFLQIVKAYKVLDVLAREGRPIEAEVQVIALGPDLAWVGLPGEIFVELGLALRRASPFRHTIIAELAGGSVGYVPTRQAYTQGQYEVITSRVAAGSGERLVETATRMLRALYPGASGAGK